MYTEKVLDHFLNPRNTGELVQPHGIGEVGNAVCGDIMRIYIQVDGNVITDVKFKTFGCGAAIATSSMVTEMVKGKTIRQAMQVTNKLVAEALGDCHLLKCTVQTWQQMLYIRLLRITKTKNKLFS